MENDVRIRPVGGDKYVVESGEGERKLQTGPLSLERAQARAVEMKQMKKNKNAAFTLVVVMSALATVGAGLVSGWNISTMFVVGVCVFIGGSVAAFWSN